MSCNRSSPKGLLAVVRELRILLQESAAYHQDLPLVVGVFEESLDVLRAFAGRLSKATDRYVVAVVGLTNVGKSTFLNALMGPDLAPRRNGPCTSAVIEFHYGEDLRVSATRRSSIKRNQWTCSCVEQVHERLASVADDSGEFAGEDIHSVRVEAPIPILRHGLIISDTPGFGAAQIGGKEGTHEAALKTYLKEHVSQVLWVVLAEQGIGKTEKSFHDAFFAEVCDDVIVTGCEGWDAADKLRFKRRFSQQFGKPMLRFHFISGLQGLVARNSGNEAELASSGISGLEQRITELSLPQGRVASIEGALEDLSRDLHDWLDGFRSGRNARLSDWWRPDSWARWESACPDDPLKLRITRILRP